MKKLLFLFTLLALFSCSSDDETVNDDNLITNSGFEDGTAFSFENWSGYLTSPSSDTPNNGGNYSLQIEPGWAPDKGFAETTITNLEGTNSLKFNCDVKVINWIGYIFIYKENANGDRIEITHQSFDNTAWENISFDINTSFNSTDLLIVRLSANMTEAGIGKVLFDNVTLTN